MWEHDEIRRIFAVEGVDVLDDHLEGLVGSVPNTASSRSTMNKAVDVDCCTPCTSFLLTQAESKKLGLCPLGVHTVCHLGRYRCGCD